VFVNSNRTRQQFQRQAFVLQTANNTQPPSSSRRTCAELAALSPEDLIDLTVTLATVEEEGARKECPICLETKPEWASFPCSHGCCATCLADLIKYSNKRTDKVNGVGCPLCRKLAVVAVTEGGAQQVEEAQRAGEAQQAQPIEEARVTFFPRLAIRF
jgi:uncharacterized protein YjiS (DUF1127 family)